MAVRAKQTETQPSVSAKTQSNLITSGAIGCSSGAGSCDHGPSHHSLSLPKRSSSVGFSPAGGWLKSSPSCTSIHSCTFKRDQSLRIPAAPLLTHTDTCKRLAHKHAQSHTRQLATLKPPKGAAQRTIPSSSNTPVEQTSPTAQGGARPALPGKNAVRVGQCDKCTFLPVTG